MTQKSKAELCKELYAAMAGDSSDGKTVVRKEFIERAVKECGCTPAGASTYYSNCKTVFNGGSVKSYYQPADKIKTDNRVDDSKVDAPLWSIVVVDDGKVAECHSFMSEQACLAKYNSLKPKALAVCLPVVGSPKAGVEVSSLTRINTQPATN